MKMKMACNKSDILGSIEPFQREVVSRQFYARRLSLRDVASLGGGVRVWWGGVAWPAVGFMISMLTRFV